VDGYSGDAGNALAENTFNILSVANFKRFSTFDNDNDAWFHGSCTADTGWWFGHCSTSNLNGAFGGALWDTNEPPQHVQATRMLVKVN